MIFKLIVKRNDKFIFVSFKNAVGKKIKWAYVVPLNVNQKLDVFIENSDL